MHVTLSLDTGVTVTVIRPRYLVAAGYQLSTSGRSGRLRSATGSGLAPFVDVSAISCLGKVRTAISVLAHDMPPVVTCDGLLGLDFFRGYVLNLDFIRGRIELRAGRWWQFWR